MYVKKQSFGCIGCIMLLGLIVLCVLPQVSGLVWVTPMKMLAEGTITDGDTVEVEKALIVRNDANTSVQVVLNASGVTVVFEESIVTLGPQERRVLHPVVVVGEGRVEGVISVKAMDSESGGGSRIVSTMSITVMAVGVRSDGGGFALDSGGIVVASLVGGMVFGVVAVGSFWVRRRNGGMIVSQLFRCPGCDCVSEFYGHAGELVSVRCQKCGESGQIMLPNT